MSDLSVAQTAGGVNITSAAAGHKFFQSKGTNHNGSGCGGEQGDSAGG